MQIVFSVSQMLTIALLGISLENLLMRQFEKSGYFTLASFMFLCIFLSRSYFETPMKLNSYRDNYPEDAPQTSFKWPSHRLWHCGVLMVLSLCAARGFDNYLMLSNDALTVDQIVFLRCMRDLSYVSAVTFFFKTAPS